MLEIYGDKRSGNCYKIKLLASFLGIDYIWHEVDIVKKDNYHAEFLVINPLAKVPALVIDKQKILLESNAIMNYLAKNSAFIPTDDFEYGQMLQWQFYDSDNIRANLAPIRWIKKFQNMPDARQAEYEQKFEQSQKILTFLNEYLQEKRYFVAEKLTLADISLFAYISVAGDGGIDLQQFPFVCQWLDRIKNQPNFIAFTY